MFNQVAPHLTSHAPATLPRRSPPIVSERCSFGSRDYRAGDRVALVEVAVSAIRRSFSSWPVCEPALHGANHRLPASIGALVELDHRELRITRVRAQTLELDDQVGERVPAWGNQPDAVFESREFIAAIDRALGELPLDYRAAVTLRDVEGLSTAEAAEVLGIGERARKSRLHRGRMALRAQLDGYFQSGYVK
jgi:RNA polymerase sigma factor (sigma-70 family)